MKSEKVKNFLIQNGYKDSRLDSGDASHVVAKYFRVPWEADVPFCLLNHKQPQFCIQESFITVPGAPDYHFFRIFIHNQAPQGWVDFGFYSINEKELIAGLPEFEAALLKSWSGLFEK